ncbi:MAG: PASTA domain-containing protein [Clostridiales bacterium]|nr:PASTA domain-containing protein [Clostridiales bacterium]
MINTEELCMSCMNEIGKLKQCPHCGFHRDSPQIAPYLPFKTVLGSRYLVGKLLDSNGEGATYIGWDLTNRVPVNIREFLPDGVVTRSQDSLDIQIVQGREHTFKECSRSFFDMWRQLARLRGLTALINTIDIIEENGTAYAISEYFEGATLREFLLKSKTGYISWERARQLFMPVLSTLGTLHTSGVVHRGLSPSTLLIGKDGKVRISGFSIWQARTTGSELTPQLFNGYSAIEQYGGKGSLGPWTDIYAFGAVLYRSLIGSDPLDATDRAVNDKLMVPGKFAEQIPAYVINALINSLQILPNDRTRTVDLLRGELSASPTASANAEAQSVPVNTVQPANGRAAVPQKKRTKKDDQLIAIKAGAITFSVGLLIFILLATTVWRNDIFKPKAPPVDSSTAVVTLAEEVEVQDFAKIGTYPVIVSNPIWSKMFTFLEEKVYSNEPVGTIIAQSIPEGTKVAKGSEITLTVSQGKEMVDLPPGIIGMEYEAAKTLLTELGFSCSKIDEANDGTKAPNTISAVNLPLNQKHEKGTKIVMKVWMEAETTTDAP